MARFVWLMVWERDDGDETRWSPLVRWAMVGLAVLGVAAVIVWRVWNR